MEDKTDLVLATLTGITLGLCFLGCLRYAWVQARSIATNEPKMRQSPSRENLTDPTNSV